MTDNNLFLIRRQRRFIDQYRIVFRCQQQPEQSSQLIGFEADKEYVGRYYNGLYEVAVDWGRSTPFLIGRQQFAKYFTLLKSPEMQFPA